MTLTSRISFDDLQEIKDCLEICVQNVSVTVDLLKTRRGGRCRWAFQSIVQVQEDQGIEGDGGFMRILSDGDVERSEHSP